MNEFEIINKYLKPLSFGNRGALKLKDDIFFDFSKKVAISIDTYVHGNHFIETQPELFLKKILRSSLSDLYCKGIKPESYFLSLSLNKKIATHAWFKKISQILRSEQKKFKITLVGGDTTKSTKLTATIVVLGFSKKKPILRSSCNNNDDIYVTGNLCDSYIGLKILKKKHNFGYLNKYFVKKYYEPNLPIRIVPYLHEIASASIDISDGLAQDLNHITSISNYGAIVNLNSIPVSTNCKILIDKGKLDIKDIFSRGDDYQILFTAKPKNYLKIINLSRKKNIKITKIGTVNKTKNILFKHNNVKFRLNAKNLGYTHNF